MANIIYARVMQKTATLDEWMSSDLVLLDGEQAFVVGSDGSPINFKIGDGTKTFSELPFWIQYDQAQYISIDSNALPTPTQNVGYSLVGSGTYTKAGQADVVVPSGHMGILNWDGSVWYLGSSVEMPQRPLPIGLLNIETGSFDFDTVNKTLHVSGIGSVNLSKDRILYTTPQTINFPDSTSGYYALIFDPSTGNFSIHVQSMLSGVNNTNIYVASILLDESTRELIVNGVPTYTQNGKNPPNSISEWVGVRYVTGDVVLHNNEFWIANQNTLPASEPGASDRWDLLLNKYRRGQLIAPSNFINFNLTDKKIEISGTVAVSVGSSRYLVNTPQEIDFPGISGGYYAMMLNINSWQATYGDISLVNINDVSSVDPKYIFVGSFVIEHTYNDLVVNGISDYLINGQPKSFRLPDWVDRAYRPGELVYHNNRTWKANDPQPIVGSVPGVSARWSELHPQKQGYFNGPASSLNFDLTEKTITTSGTSAIVINGERMLITPGQEVDFPSENGGYFALLFRKSGGVISTVAVNNLGSVDPSLILFGTYLHDNFYNTVVVNGVPDYYINGVPKDEKFFTFDSGLPYYNATTDLSMTENDPIVLKDQFVDYLYGLYDGLMAQHPEYITKKQFGAQDDGNGGELPLYYYRFRPSNLIKNTSAFGGDQRLKVVITAATHGGEKTGGMATWILMDAICNQWQDDEYLQALRWNCEFVVVACASPYQWNQNALGLSPGRLNANGVDPNRNYPQGWAGGNSDPGSTDYRGPSPLSEIECQAVYNLLKEEYTHGAIAFDFHTYVGSSAPYDIAWVIAPSKTNNQAQAFARLIAREYKKKLPVVDQNPDTPIARISDNVAGGMTYKTYDAMGYRAYLMEINENFMIVPGYERNDNYALKYGTESMANMLRLVIKKSTV